MAANEVRSGASAIEAVIPRPPADVALLRRAFAGMVSNQWQSHVPEVLRGCKPGIGPSNLAKGRFIGEMYARACYSMLLVSQRGPLALRIPVRVCALLPQSRKMTVTMGSALLGGIGKLLPQSVHRQLLLTSALMGMLDVVLDEAAVLGDAAALRVASLVAEPSPVGLGPEEEVIVALARSARQAETPWQAEYWSHVVQPAVLAYCRAEVLGVEHQPDPTGMGHRWAGIEAAIKGMWYVTGPLMGLQELGGATSGAAFQRSRWNREQQWMADTSLLMQMIDDWFDQDEDRGARLTPVVTGDWTLETAAELFGKTGRDLDMLLEASGIRRPVLKAVITDLYKDYLHAAMDAMRTGIAS